ncbi:hypothetical protein Q9966_010146 [Columba livia]|nr:hypothetical protein Q9966_010146 [Columba livia]
MALSAPPPARVFAELTPARALTPAPVPAGRGGPPGREVHVSGSAELSASPDRARVSLRLSSRKDAAGAARSSVARRLEYIAQSARQRGVPVRAVTRPPPPAAPGRNASSSAALGSQGPLSRGVQPAPPGASPTPLGSRRGKAPSSRRREQRRPDWGSPQGQGARWGPRPSRLAAERERGAVSAALGKAPAAGAPL